MLGSHSDLKIGQQWFVRIDDTSAAVQGVEIVDLHMPELVRFKPAGDGGWFKINKIDWIQKTLEPKDEEKAADQTKGQ